MRPAVPGRRTASTPSAGFPAAVPSSNPTDADTPHLGELIRESMEEVGWSVTEMSARLGCERAA